MNHLWNNEASLCSFICDIQREQLSMSSKTEGDSIFFLRSILVPPTKFRPAAKGGDSVSCAKDHEISLSLNMQICCFH